MNTLNKLTMLTSMVFLFCAIPTMAQVDSRVTFDAPFAFYAGNTRMPAGSYSVTQPDHDTQLLLIESADGSHSVFVEFVPDEPDNPASATEIAFNKYANADFLSRISVQGQNPMQILATKVEQNAAKAAAAEKHTLSAKNGRKEKP